MTINEINSLEVGDFITWKCYYRAKDKWGHFEKNERLAHIVARVYDIGPSGRLGHKPLYLMLNQKHPRMFLDKIKVTPIDMPDVSQAVTEEDKSSWRQYWISYYDKKLEFVKR